MTHSCIYQYHYVYHCLSLIVIDYLYLFVAFVEYTGIFVMLSIVIVIISTPRFLKFLHNRCVSLVPSSPFRRHVPCPGGALRSAQGTIGGNHKGLLGVPLPSLQPGAMDGMRFHQRLVVSWELMGSYAENR